MRKIYVLVGSLRKKSFNLALAKSFEEITKDLFSFEYCPLVDLPMYNQDLEENFPQVALNMKKSIEKADGILFFTPEYNRGLPAVLKNAIDWASRPYAQNTWAGKHAGVLGVAVGAAGTAVAQANLRSILVMLGMQVMGSPEMQFSTSTTPDLFAADGTIQRQDTRSFIRSYAEKFATRLG